MSVPSCLCGGEVYTVPNPNSAEPMATYYCAACGKTLAYMPRAHTAHTQAQRLAAMFPTLEPEPAVDPRTAMENAIDAWVAAASVEQKATMYQRLNAEGMTCERADATRRRMWERRK